MLRMLMYAGLALIVSVNSWGQGEYGSFKATEVCDLYRSKRNLTNPDEVKTTPGKLYRIAGISGGELYTPEWLYVQTDATPATRWVRGSCGVASVEQKVLRPPVNCDTPNDYDSHVLAISWQPAFCEMKSNKPECKTLDTGRYDAAHFTLHGLWPNKQACMGGRSGYGNCGVVKKSFKSFCDYPAMNLEDVVRENLGVAMPSARYGSCLQRHEWWKHGVCRDTDPNVYFNLAMALLKQVNLSGFRNDFIEPNIGKMVQRSDFEAAFDKSFGAGASKRLKLSCHNRKLTEIQMALPKELPATSTLGALLAQVPGNRDGSCDATFELDLAGN